MLRLIKLFVAFVTDRFRDVCAALSGEHERVREEGTELFWMVVERDNHLRTLGAKLDEKRDEIDALLQHVRGLEGALARDAEAADRAEEAAEQWRGRCEDMGFTLRNLMLNDLESWQSYGWKSSLVSVVNGCWVEGRDAAVTLPPVEDPYHGVEAARVRVHAIKALRDWAKRSGASMSLRDAKDVMDRWREIEGWVGRGDDA